MIKPLAVCKPTETHSIFIFNSNKKYRNPVRYKMLVINSRWECNEMFCVQCYCNNVSPKSDFTFGFFFLEVSTEILRIVHSLLLSSSTDLRRLTRLLKCWSPFNQLLIMVRVLELSFLGRGVMLWWKIVIIGMNLPKEKGDYSKPICHMPSSRTWEFWKFVESTYSKKVGTRRACGIWHCSRF